MGQKNHVAVVEGRTADQAQSIAASEPATQISFALPLLTLWWRELVRFARQRSRVLGLIAPALLFWLFIGSGLGASFHPPTAEISSAHSPGAYLQYFFPGTVVGIVLFASVVGSMSVIEDRKEGFLLSVLVAPIYRVSLVLGKVLGGTTQAVIPGLLFLLISPAIGFKLRLIQFAALTAVLFLIAFGLTCLGFLIAWRMDSTSGFHAVLNLVLFPMWVLSGAWFPASGASRWVQWVMNVNPLTYGLAALRRLLYWHTAPVSGDVAPMGLSLGITVLFAAVVLIASLIWTGRPAKNLG